MRSYASKKSNLQNCIIIPSSKIYANINVSVEIQIFFKTSHCDYFQLMSSSFIQNVNDENHYKVTIQQKQSDKRCSNFTIFALLVQAKQCTNLKKTRNDLEENSENTSHLSSNIEWTKLNKKCLKRFF